MAQANPVQQYFAKRRSTSWSLLKGLESRAVFKSAGSLQGASVLDLGAGDGFYARRGLRHGAGNITCVDFCNHLLETLPERITTRAANIETESVTASNFDHVFCLGVLEFLEEPRPFLERLSESMRADSRITLLYPPRKGFFTRLYQRFHRRHGIPLQTFRSSEIQSWLWARGLKLESRRHPHPYAVVETYVRK